MSIRLDDLDYFLAVVRWGQVRRAAQELSVTQPALTKAIQRLERGLGFTLFERSRSGMKLTAGAEVFYERTRTARASIGEAIKEAADLHLGAIGVLRVGVSPLYAQRVFVPAAVQLHRQRPAARLVININLNDVLLSALGRGDIDLSLNAVPAVVPEGLHVQPLFDDHLCIVVRPGHALLSRRLSLVDLVDARWMLPGPGVEARRRVEALFAQAQLPPPQVAVEISNTAAQLQGLLAATDLVAVASETMLLGEGGQRMAVLDLPQARLPRQVGVFTRSSGILSPLARRLVELLRAQTLDAPQAAGA